MLSKAVLKAIGSEVDEVFDRISDRFLGTKYVPHGIEFKVMTLEDFFKDIAEREGIDPDKDSLSTLKDIAESYLDSARERAKAQVTQSIQQVIREAILTGETPNIEVALEGALTKVWGDVTTHVHTILDSEINTARNVSIMEGITQYNAQIGVDDPVVFFVIVRDGAVCNECIRLHMMPDGVTPRVWKLSEVGSGYHKKGDPNPKIGGLHPHCRCIMTTLLPKFGFNASGMVTFIGEDHDEFAKQRGMAKSEGLVKGARGDWRNEGYFFTVTHHEDHPKFGGEAVEVQAHHPQHGQVGGTLVRVGESGYWTPSMTEVLPKHRRKGLANEMYRLAEERLGEQLVPDSHQTSHARKLWKQPNRPFGMEIEEEGDDY